MPYMGGYAGLGDAAGMAAAITGVDTSAGGGNGMSRDEMVGVAMDVLESGVDFAGIAERTANMAAMTQALVTVIATSDPCYSPGSSIPRPLIGTNAQAAMVAVMTDTGAARDLVDVMADAVTPEFSPNVPKYNIGRAERDPDFESIVTEGHNFSAGKYKWLIDKPNMYGKAEFGSVEFFPWNQIPGPSGLGGPITSNQSIPSRVPPNVPSRYHMSYNMGAIGDTFRFTTGKMWLNQGHLDGLLATEPAQDATDLSYHGLSKQEFEFFNKTNILMQPSPSEGGKVMLMRPSEREMRTKILPVDRWLSMDRALDIFQQRNVSIRFEIFQETFKIGFPGKGVIAPNSRWNWRNYMYGLPFAGANLELFRERAQNTREPQYRRYGTDSFLSYRGSFDQVVESKNIFPVVPFYKSAGRSGALLYGTSLQEFQDPNLRPGGSYAHVFTDHVTKIPDFLTKEQMDKTDFNTGIYADIYSSYNHYDRVYEEILSPFYEEVRLPNYYKFVPQRSVNRNREAREREELILRENLLRLQQPGNTAAQNLQLIRERAALEYGIFVPERFPEIDTIDVYPNPGIDVFKEVYEERNMFPMYTGLEITTNTESKLVQAMRVEDRDNLFDLLFPLGFPNDGRGIGNGPQELRYDFQSMKLVTQYLGSSTQEEDQIRSAQSFFVRNLTENVDFNIPGRRGRRRRRRDNSYIEQDELRIQPSAKTQSIFSDIIEEDIQYTDLNEWLETLENNRTQNRSMPQEVFRSALSKAIMTSRIKKIVDENYRSNFEKVLSGHPAYSEIVGYRVDKLDEEGNIIQTFMFGNMEDVNLVRYVDSQVEYGRRYLYKVSSIVMIIGTRYLYLDCMNDDAIERFYVTSRDQLTDISFYFGVMHTPSVRIAVVPMHTREIIVMDKPPIPPDVNIIPFKGVKNKVLFWMNSNTGELTANPIILEPDDHGQFDMVRISQREVYAGSVPRKRSDGTRTRPVKFKNDDPTKTFEIFRIETPPLSWDDFFENKLARIESEATSTTFEDEVMPNKKYYYTFRAEDVHGHVSNPSHIYEVELISEDDMVYMNMSIWNFPKPVQETKTNFKSKVMIMPALFQTLIPLPENGSFLDWDRRKEIGSVGTPDQPGEVLWDKKFKCRVTSKSTGKQFDINFKFVKKFNRIEDNIEINS